MSTGLSRTLRRLAPALVMALAILVAVPPTARAELTSVVAEGVLAVTSDEAGDSIQISCQGSNVKVNQLDPGTGPADCSSITTIDVDAGAGSDTIDVSQVTSDRFTTLVSISVSGGEGDDRITGSSFDDALEGGLGDDRLAAGSGTDSLDGGRGTDELSMRSAGNVTLTDALVTHPGGSLTLLSVEFADIRAADPSVPVEFDASDFSNATVLIGSDADDTLIGGRAADLLIAGDGNDVSRGGRGDDLIDPGIGTDDSVDGGRGTDTLLLRGGGDFTVTDSSIEGTDTGRLAGIEALQGAGGSGDDRVDASGFSGTVIVRGGDGDDVLLGGTGDDSLDGGAGNDRLVGGDGDDRLRGNEGSDQLRGGPGDDVLDGGPGKDRCRGGTGTNSLLNC